MWDRPPRDTRLRVKKVTTQAGAMRLWLMKISLLLVAFLMLAIGQIGAARAEQEFLDPKEAFVFSAAMHSPTEVDVHFRIAPEYYMYRERFAFQLAPDAGLLGDAIYPKGVVKYDPTFERDLEVYHDQVTVRLPITAGGSGPMTLAVTSQGCANAGLCYPPMTSEVTITPTAAGYALSGAGVVEKVPAPQDEPDKQKAEARSQDAGGTASTLGGGIAGVLDLTDLGLASYLSQAGWFQIVGLCLLLGLLLSFTPCVLTMVPILLSIIAGGNASANGTRANSKGRGFALAAVYVLGMSIVYTALGVAAGLVGAGLSAWLQTPWVLTVFAVLLALLALAMFDVFTFQAPQAMQSALSARLARIPGGHYSGAFVMGMLSALIVGPCVAAPLAGVLLFISQTGDVVLGGAALFALAWGEGLLLLLVGLSSGALLPKAGPWMDGIKRFFGVLLLATAWWMMNSVVPASVSVLGWAALAMWAAVLMGAFESVAGRIAGARVGFSATASRNGAGLYLLKALGLMLAFWSVLMLVGLAAGARDIFRPLAPFAQITSPATGWTGSAGGVPGGSPAGPAPGLPGAIVNKESFVLVRSVAELDSILANAQQPVMLDFYADWCVSCIQMEKFTFSDPQVAAKMSQMLLVQADVTSNTDDDRALLKRFNLFGPPGIIFFDQQGRQINDARVIGFKNAQQFGAVLDRVLAR